MVFLKYTFMIFIFTYNINNLISQQESGVREFNKQAFQNSRIWYDSSTANYQTQYPIILNIPPLNSGMPLDILVSYVMLDSLLQNTYAITLDQKLKTWSSMNDTIANATKFLYLLSDYNPIIFQQFAYATTDYFKFPTNLIKSHSITIDSIINKTTSSIDSNTWSGKYTLDLFDLSSLIRNRYNDFVGLDELKVSNMLRPDYILKVRVNSIDSVINVNNYGNEFIYKVNAEVLDTIKGQVFKNECINNTSQIKANNTKMSLNNACINFMYRNVFYNSDRNPKNLILEPSFTYNGDDFRMKVGQEAIVFLKFNRRFVDFSNDYFELYLDLTSSFCALAIENNQVKDLNHFWNNQNLIDYNIWKSNFNIIKNKILTKGY